MRLKGVCYDVGVVMGINWRPVFEPRLVQRELEIIRSDLHCNAVRIVGRDLSRLLLATESALQAGLQVWLFPEFWNRTERPTARRMARIARAVEPLHQTYGDRIVFGVGMEVTLFSRGILPGHTLAARVKNPNLRATIKEGRHNGPLNRFLSGVVAAVRQSYRGKLTYASLVWEQVDWAAFDFVGVDHYWSPRLGERYLEMLRPAVATGKPVIITEFGHDTMLNGPLSQGFLGLAGLNPSMIDTRTLFLHHLPVVGRMVRPRLIGPCVRDEAVQARKLVEQLNLLESAGVAGGFVSQFESQISPYDPDPRYDLDMASSSLVRYLERGRGSAYPEMPWEPKLSFHAVSDYYLSH